MTIDECYDFVFFFHFKLLLTSLDSMCIFFSSFF